MSITATTESTQDSEHESMSVIPSKNEIVSIEFGFYKRPLSSRDASKNNRQLPKNQNSWYVLGTFDYCNIRESKCSIIKEQDTPFLEEIASKKHQIQQPNNSLELDPRNKLFYGFLEEDRGWRVEKDWNKKIFQFVVFVHFLDVSSLEQRKSLQSVLSGQKTVNNGKSEDCEGSIDKTVQYKLYRALDCCDRILILRANDEAALLRTVYLLNQIECVNYTYSITSLWCKASSDEKKVHAYIRAQASDSNQIDDIYDPLKDTISKDNIFVIPGNEDIFIDCPELSINTLIKFEETLQCKQLKNVVTTLLTTINLGEISPKESAQKRFSAHWIACVKRIKMENIYLPTDWLDTFWGLLKELEYIENTGYAKTVFYQSAPVINSFIKIIASDDFQTAISKRNPNQCYKIRSLMNRFVRGMIYLLHQSTNIDLQIVQFPSRNPTPIAYPAKLAAAYSAYCYQIGDILHASDGLIQNTKKSNTSPCSYLVVPKLCARIANQILFSSDINSAGVDSMKSRVIYLDIPFQCLYDPSFTMIALTHEVAHTVGSNCRMRQSRGKVLLDAMLTEYLNALNLLGDDEKTNGDFVRLTRQMLHNLYRIEWQKNHAGKPEFLKDQKTVAMTAMRTLVEQIDWIEKYREYSPTYSELYQTLMEACSSDVRDENADNLVKSVLQLQRDVSHYQEKNLHKRTNNSHVKPMQIQVRFLADLLKECYADVIMIELLNLRFEDYINSFWVSEKQDLVSLENPDGDPRKLFEQVEKTRVQCVMHCLTNIDKRDAARMSWTISHNIVNPEQKDLLSPEKQLKIELKNLFVEAHFDATQFKSTNLITPVTIVQIAKYLSECMCTLRASIDKDTKLKENLASAQKYFKDLQSMKHHDVTTAVYNLLELHKERVNELRSALPEEPCALGNDR